MAERFEPLPEIPPEQFALDIAREDIERARDCGYEFHVNAAGELRWTKPRTNTKAERLEFMSIMEVMDTKKAGQVLKMDFDSGKFKQHNPDPVEEIKQKPVPKPTSQVEIGI